MCSMPNHYCSCLAQVGTKCRCRACRRAVDRHRGGVDDVVAALGGLGGEGTGEGNEVVFFGATQHLQASNAEDADGCHDQAELDQILGWLPTHHTPAARGTAQQTTAT